jgi:hypothetical protein
VSYSASRSAPAGGASFSVPPLLLISPLLLLPLLLLPPLLLLLPDVLID